MKDRTFSILLIALTVLGFLVTAGLLLWAAVLHGEISVITYLAKEVW